MKILVVDDNPRNSEQLSCLIQDGQHHLRQAANGKEAVDLVQSDIDIDLVLMEIDMPVMDGFEATRAIRQLQRDRHLPIIFIAAVDDETVLTKCLTIGGDDFIPKPVNESLLLAKLAVHQRTMDIREELSYYRQLIGREHRIVEAVFHNSTRRNERNCSNVKFHLSPLGRFNGDLLLISPNTTGGVYVLLGDFTGHGLSAAVGCLPVSDVFYAMAKKRAGVSAIAREMNAKLQDILPDNMFFCAAILELDGRGERLTVWSGGMNDILLLDAEGAIKGRVQAQHMPLGVLSDDELEDFAEVIKPVLGLRAYVYSDGVIEARNPSGELFGEERLEQLLSATTGPCVDTIVRAIEGFQDGGDQSDDISLVELLCQPVVYENRGSQVTEDAVHPSAGSVPALPWQVKLVLQPQHLRCETTIIQIVTLMTGIESANTHKDIFFTLVSELFNNALEHGLLKLDSRIKEDERGFQRYYELRKERLDKLVRGEIVLQIQAIPGAPNRIELSLTDSGEGFDMERIIVDEVNNTESYARGVFLVRSLCEQLHYTNGGRTATLVYALR